MRSGAFNAEWVLGGTTRLAIRIRVFSDKLSQLIKCICSGAFNAEWVRGGEGERRDWQ